MVIDPNNIGDKFKKDMEKRERCQGMKQSLDSLEKNIRNQIDSFSGIGTDFANANLYNNIHGWITAVQGVTTVVSLSLNLAQNAARYPTLAGAPPSLNFANTLARHAIAGGYGGREGVQELGKELIQESSVSAERWLAPFSLAAKQGVEAADLTSRQTSKAFNEMQDGYARAKAIYEQDCGETK